MRDFSHVLQLLQHFTDIGPAGCAVSISLEGETIFQHYEGYADLENRTSIDADTRYRMFSSVKLVSILGAMILYERGAFLLTDPVERYLPEFASPSVCFHTGNNCSGIRPATRSIIIGDLLTMTSGYPYWGDFSAAHRGVGRVYAEMDEKGSFSIREFVSALAKVPLAFDPGTSWSYGPNLEIMSAIIEVITKQSFASFIRQEVFEPLDMADTQFFFDPTTRGKVAKCYNRTADGKLEPFSEMDYWYDPRREFVNAGGTLVSTVGDMANLAAMYANGGRHRGQHILSESTIDLMRENHLRGSALLAYQATHEHVWTFLRGYGYGLGVRTLLDPALAGSAGAVGEFGWAGAAGTWSLCDPAKKLAVSYCHQLMPDNMEAYCHPRLRNAIYASLD